MKRHLLTLALTAAAALCALADNNVTSVSISQRWPWNCKVDVTYTLQADSVTTNPCPVFETLFTAYLGDTQYVMKSVSGEGASGLVFNEGVHVLTWDAGTDLPADTQADNLKVTVSATDVSNFSTYLRLNCATGQVTHHDTAPATYTEADKTDYMWFRRIEPGSFWAGSRTNELYRTLYDDGINGDDKELFMEVTITRPFYIGVFEVTQGQERALGYTQPVDPDYNPVKYPTWCYWDMPTEKISYSDIRGASAGLTWPEHTDHRVDEGSFLDFLRKKAGGNLLFDLPTDWQWEMAARGGVWSPYWYNGAEIVGSDNINTNLTPIAWWASISGSIPKKVGQKLPNAYGLYDTIGNVAEITLNHFAIREHLAEAVLDPVGPTAAENVTYCYRGGSAGDGAKCCRPARRDALKSSDFRNTYIGVRLAIIL